MGFLCARRDACVAMDAWSNFGGTGIEPFNFHVNGLLKSPRFRFPILVEIQIWITSIMALNDVSHAQYEVARAKEPKDI